MIQFANLITPITIDSEYNAYVIGVSLKNSYVTKIKIYNKIYTRTTDLDNFAKRFGGFLCYTHFTKTDDWRLTGHSFSGFTFGVEFYFKDLIWNHHYGYGFKKYYPQEVFHSFILNDTKDIIKQEDYYYTLYKNYGEIKKPFKTRMIEYKKNDTNSFCLCPSSEKIKIKDMQEPLLKCVSTKNKKITKKIISHNFSIVNYGQSGEEEKVYFLHRKSNQIEPILNLLVDTSLFEV